MSSFLPQYSTSSGDAHGYNERSGMSTNIYTNRYEGANFRGAPTWGNTSTLQDPSKMATRGFPPASSQPTQAIPNFAATRDVQAQVSAPLAPTQNLAQMTSPYVRTQDLPRQNAGTRGIGDPVPGATYRAREADVSTRAIDTMGPMGRIDDTPTGPPSANKPRLSFDQEQSAMAYGKDSVSRRLPETERLRYHVPGYMGFVRRQQFHHGQTYGATTRTCILGYKPDSTPAL
jgi:hypothetical protein